jgi:ATP-binding cassette subfamily B protein
LLLDQSPTTDGEHVSQAVTRDADQPLRALWQRYRAYRARFIGAVVASTINKVADVMPELLIGAAVDVVVRGDASFVGEVLGVESRYAQLGWIAAFNVVVWIIESGSEYVASVLWRGLAQGVEHDLRVEAYDHVQHLDLGWHEARPAGSTLATLNDDVNQLERFLDIGAPAILQTALNVLLVGGVFAVASGQLLVLAFLPIPLIVVGSLVFQRRLEPLYVRVRGAVADLSGTLSANLAGIATIKAFTAEDRERDRVAAVSQAYRDANTSAIRSSAAFVPLVRMAILAGFTCTLLLGGWATLRGDLEVGLYSVLVFMTQRLLWPLTDVAEVLDLYQRGRASASRILDLLEEPVTVPAGTTALARPVAGRIELKGVRSGYGDGPDVLHDIDLVVPAGETHAIVGATGSG